MAKFAFTKPKRDHFLQCIREGMRRGAAADVVFGEENPQRRRQVREYILEHVEFEAAVLDAEVEATEHVEEALYQAAISGSVAAAKTWLELKGRKLEVKPTSATVDPVGETPPEAEDPADAFAELDNVRVIDPRARRGA